VLPSFVESSIDAYNHTYTLDLSTLKQPFGQVLVAGAAAVVVLALLVRSFTLRTMVSTIFWGAVCSFWIGLGLSHRGGWLGGLGEEGHVLKLFRAQLQPLGYSLLGAALLSFGALAALYLTRPLGQRYPAWRVPVGLSLLGVMGWAGSAAVQALHAVAVIGHVPVLEFEDLHPVQVGYPFLAVPTGGRWVGLESNVPSFDCDYGFRTYRVPMRLTVGSLSNWKLPKEPYLAQQAGDNVATFRMAHDGPVRFFVQTHFHVQAEPETGNPLFPLRVGDSWTYRAVGGAHNKQVLLRQFAKNAIITSKRDNVEVAPESLVIKVERARIEDGMRIFEIRVGSRKPYLASMWSGETYLMREEHRLLDRKTWVPILNTGESVAVGSKELFPCGLSILYFDGECLCNAAPIDAKRSLLGLAHCIEQRRISHDGSNALSAIFGLLTLGATGFHMRGPESRYQGILLESSSP
jgi:hypothetical protein